MTANKEESTSFVNFTNNTSLIIIFFLAIANSNADYMFLTAWPKNNMGEIL
jgi:hypothetical protein